MQVRQSQKMEAIGRLAGGVAHEFNNLLTIMNGYTDLLLQSLPPNDPMREKLDEVHKAGERARSLTRQLLVFSRQSVLEPKVLNLNDVVADTEKMLCRLIGEDITLTLVLEPKLAAVKIDPGQLQLALLNLAANARDAMPQGGQLTTRTQNVEWSEAECPGIPDCRPGRYAMLAVSDTGTGMDEAIKNCIFEPFFTTKEPGEGTGLGLAMVYGFVKSSGGFICVSSQPGQGTTFQLYFPQVQERGSSSMSRPDVSTPPRGSETVLLVEDDDAVRALARHVLQISGYTVLEASNGRDAVQLAENHQGQIHLLVTDVVLPFLGGQQIAVLLRAMKPDLKVLYCSGYPDDAIVQHGTLEGGAAFLQKPYSPFLLAQKVRDVLDGLS
jgi:CheY-like chemotaxis protein